VVTNPSFYQTVKTYVRTADPANTSSNVVNSRFLLNLKSVWTGQSLFDLFLSIYEWIQ